MRRGGLRTHAAQARPGSPFRRSDPVRPVFDPSHPAGSPLAFTAALACVALWAAVGHFFGFSEGWQLVINTGTTIVTFLMVFLIQQSQNKDSVALHLKLDELLASNKQASNRMIGIECLDEQDLQDVAAFYVRLTEQLTTSGWLKERHSIDEEGMPAGASHVSAETSATAGLTSADSGDTPAIGPAR